MITAAPALGFEAGDCAPRLYYQYQCETAGRPSDFKTVRSRETLLSLPKSSSLRLVMSRGLRFAAVRSAVWLAVVGLGSVLCAGDTNVPRFLTGRQTSAADLVHPPEHWSATENVAWKTDIAGLGWSSPIVWNGRIFLTSCINTSKDRKPRKGLYSRTSTPPSIRPTKAFTLGRRSASTWRAENRLGTGRLQGRSREAASHQEHARLGNSHDRRRAAVRAVRQPGTVLLLASTAGRCGTCPIAARDTRYGWGTSMSPVVFGDRVYYADDNEESPP